MRKTPCEGDIYRHFKGNIYQIVTIARHSESQEEMVVYRPMYNNTGNWVRPLDMFLSEVDHEKYPDVTQKYRFTKMERGKAVEEEELAESLKPGPEPAVADRESEPAAANAESEPAAANAESEEQSLDPLLERFLDAQSYEDKLNIFYLMKRQGTPRMLEYVAMSLDIELSKSDFDEQYEEILYCLKTMEKYECNRLRS